MDDDVKMRLDELDELDKRLTSADKRFDDVKWYCWADVPVVVFPHG